MMNNNKRLLVVVPCYNEEKNILNTINNLKSNCTFDYIVIEDGSKDNSYNVLKENNVNFISHNKNLGLSEALRTGMRYALEHNYNYVIQIDGDNQHNPEDISKFLDAVNDDNVIVIGNRYNSDNYKNTLKTFAQKYISFWFKKRTKIKLLDPTNGMRLFNKEFMYEYINNNNFMVEPSTIAFIVKERKLNIIQIHTKVRQRQHGQSMYNNVWKQFKYVFKESFRMMNFHWAKKKKKEI